MTEEKKASPVSEAASEAVTGGTGPWPSGPSGDYFTYTVAPGDTLSAIARRFGVTVGEICSWNNILNPDLLVVGSKLIIYPRVMP